MTILTWDDDFMDGMRRKLLHLWRKSIRVLGEPWGAESVSMVLAAYGTKREY